MRRSIVCAAASDAAAARAAPPLRPVLMFDVMDTLVHDPFFKTMPGARLRPLRAAQTASCTCAAA
jgi:hypothetical protein